MRILDEFKEIQRTIKMNTHIEINFSINSSAIFKAGDTIIIYKILQLLLVEVGLGHIEYRLCNILPRSMTSKIKIRLISTPIYVLVETSDIESGNCSG